VKRSELRQIIKTELNEAHIDPENIRYAMEGLLEDLVAVIKKVKVEKAIAWAEKYPRSFYGWHDIAQRFIKTLEKWI